MRVISGKFKGRKLKFIIDEETRPTADFVRQAFFTKIQFDINDCIFLDLFSGSGAIGIEALSRGAKEVYFVEKNKKHYNVIKQNLISLYGENFLYNANKQGQNIYLINSDFLIFLDNFDKTKSNTVFDFVYIDPPFKSNFYKIALDKLKDNNLINNESMLICEHNDAFSFKDNISKYHLITQKKYSSKTLTYLKLI